MKFPHPLLRLLPLLDSDTLMKEGGRQGCGGEGGGLEGACAGLDADGGLARLGVVVLA